MRRIKVFAAVAALMLGITGAGCATIEEELMPSPTPQVMLTPAPTNNMGGTTPTVTQQTGTNEPVLTETGALSTGEITGGKIEDFSEGRVVDPEDVPEIVEALEREYPNCEIQSITHALHLDQQVYEVIFRNEDGQTMTVYVSPDGNITEANTPQATD